MTNENINVILDNEDSLSANTQTDSIDVIFDNNVSETETALDIEDNINTDVTTDNITVLFGDGTYVVHPITSYEELTDLPQINEVTLIKNKKSRELHLQDEMDYLTNTEIEELLNNFV